MKVNFSTFPIHGQIKYAECQCDTCKERGDWAVKFETKLRSKEKLARYKLEKTPRNKEGKAYQEGKLDILKDILGDKE